MINATGPDNVNPPVACWGAGSSSTYVDPSSNVTVYVWCSMVWQPFSSSTRTITYSACPSTQSTLPAECAAAPLLQASVTFDDYPPGIGVPTANPVSCNLTGFCGQSLTQNSWQWKPTVPVVTSISPTTATINGTNAGTGNPQTVTISGNGFVNGSSVNLVQETGPGGTPANTPTSASSGGVIINIPSSQVTWGGCSGPNNTNCTLSLTAPAVTSGTDYFVTVTTPGGTSATVPTLAGVNVDDLQYTNVTPVVSSISGATEIGGIPGGSITGGSTITISGSGFYNTSNFAAQVWFWPVGGGTKFAGTSVNVSSNTTMTAISPAVTAPGNYYVQVDTIGGNSVNTSDIFNYGVQVPIIISLSPSSGGTGTQLVITGGNFLTGSTVQFFVDNNGNQSGTGTAASATVTSPSSITVTVPALATGKYFPVITLPSPYLPPTYPASQPYNEPADIFTHT